MKISNTKDMIDFDDVLSSDLAGTAVFRLEKNQLKSIYHSDGLPNLIGYQTEEYDRIAEENALNLVIPSERAHVVDLMHDALNGDPSLNTIFQVQHKNGDAVWIHMSGLVVRRNDTILLKGIFMKRAMETMLYQDIADQATNGSYVVNDDYDILYINQKLEKHLNSIGSENGLRKKCYHFIQNREAPCENCTLKYEEPVEMVADRSKKIFKVSSHQMIWNDTNANVVYLNDVTEEKQETKRVEQEQRRYRILLDMLGIAFWEWSAKEGAYASDRYSDYAISEVGTRTVEPGIDYNQYVHPDDIQLSEAYMAASGPGETRRSTVMRTRMKDGSYRWTELFSLITVSPEGAVERVISVMCDVDKEWINQKKELQDALLEAQKANHAKTDFLSRMSHDMRTPMNAVIGLSALTLDDAEHPDVVRENMAKMRQASDFMLGLINDILDMAKIEDGSITLNMEPYTYSDFLINMKTMFLPQCEAKGIQIHFVEPEHIDPTGLTDKVRINQIFFNIFSNALKYTPTGGTIHSSVRNVTIKDNVVSGDYVISDTGIGMSKEFQEHLFEPFMQEDEGVTPELQGSGLGLSITKQLVELMGGKIQIISEKGKGTTVIVSMSFELVKKEERCSQTDIFNSVNMQTLAGKRILLVEDHPLNAQIARKLLEKEGILVAYAANGRIAVEMFEASEAGTFDGILMDIRMPELSGLDAAKAIRDLDRVDAKDVAIIAMSANAYPEDVKKSLDAGMNDHLAKPVEPKILYETLIKNMEQK